MEEKKRRRERNAIRKHLEAVVEASHCLPWENQWSCVSLPLPRGRVKRKPDRRLNGLKARYDKGRAGHGRSSSWDAVTRCTRTGFYENLIRVAASPKKQVLSEVVLETLSIIAYKQPVTKMEIEKIRGSQVGSCSQPSGGI